MPLYVLTPCADPLPVRLAGQELVGPLGVVPLSAEVVIVDVFGALDLDDGPSPGLLRSLGYQHARFASEPEIQKGVFPCA